MSPGAPPLFKQGVPARVRLWIFLALSVSLILLDSRLALLEQVRIGLASALYPVQRALVQPARWFQDGLAYLSTATDAQQASDRLQQERIEAAQLTARAAQLALENQQLRALLDLNAVITAPSVAAEVVFETRDPERHHLVVSRGTLGGIQEGMPVIDELGVVGQVVLATPFSAELRMLTDPAMRVSVQSTRSGRRAIAYGGEGPDRLGLRYLAPDADIEPGDDLVTSGLDGIYPPGIPVGRVLDVVREHPDGYARAVVEPTAEIGVRRHYLVLQTIPSELGGLQLSDRTTASSPRP